MGGLITREEIVSLAIAAGVIGESDTVEWHTIDDDYRRSRYHIAHFCGLIKPWNLFDPVPPLFVLELLLRRFAGPDRQETHVYIGRCRKCATAFFAQTDTTETDSVCVVKGGA